MGCRELQVNDYFRMTDSASGTDVPYYALADANKNITEYFDTNGNVVAHYEYSPFGKITQQSGTMASDFDYRFSSEVFDDESGLVYYNYRYYSAELGRWLNRDPINELGHILLKQAGRRNPYSNEDDNPFRHTDNDPLNNTDTNGESFSCYFLTAAAIVSFISFSVSIPGCFATGAGCIASAGLGILALAATWSALETCDKCDEDDRKRIEKLEKEMAKMKKMLKSIEELVKKEKEKNDENK